MSQINAAAGGSWVEVDMHMEQMLKLCGILHQMTEGLLDATALPYLKLWDYTRRHETLPSAEELSRARELVGWSKVELEPGRVRLPIKGMALDFGGFGKEWAVDAVVQLGREHGIHSLLVDFGHDVRVTELPAGRAAWHIAVEDPDNPGRPARSLAIPAGAGVASSGDYLRCFHLNGRRYGHIIDPRDGRPVSNGCVQATVVAPTCLMAGMLSTSAFILGPQLGIRAIKGIPSAEGLIVTKTGQSQTRGFWRYEVGA